MDAKRFDDVARSLTDDVTRRGILLRAAAALSLGGAIGPLLNVAGTDAKKKRRKKKKCKGKKKKCGKTCIPKSNCCRDADCAGVQVCQGGACILPFCSGKNQCLATAECQSSGVICVCWVTAKTGEPFCGQVALAVIDCSDCADGTTCVNASGFPNCAPNPAAVACSLPCPNPL